LVDLSWLRYFIESLGYLGALLSGFLGSSSLFIAIFPSFLVVPLLATTLNPTVVGILAGIGAGVGQYLHYYIGLGGRYLIPKTKWGNLDNWRRRLDRYGVIIIFIFAATPLTPDDLIWLPLGAMRYPKLKALGAAIIGKIVLNLIYAYAGYFGWTFLRDLFHLSGV
jgi:membrane protein YqaA with SNARE-associated domain